MRRALLRAAIVVCTLLSAVDARADAPILVPPTVATPAAPDDPRAPDARTSAASAELELEIDREGAVTAAKVTRSAGSDALDGAAIDAAKRSTFSPATKDGVTIAAKVRYEVAFAKAEEPPPPPPPTAEPARASIAGVAIDHESGKPIPGADVVVTTEKNEALHTTTDAQGVFRVDGLAPGPIHVVVTAKDHVPARLDETLDPGTLSDAKLRLEKTPDPEAFVATARVDAPPREVTKRSLSHDELSKVAGTRGDPIRAIELLPGVSRAGSGDSMPILRGANSDDSQVFIEGAPVPVLYHLAGLASVVHSRVIDTVELYPSSFGVRYGRKVGGMVEVRLRDPRTDMLHGVADLNLIDSSLLVETPVGEKFAVLAAVRRSNIDAVINAGQSTSDTAIIAAPVYWDYQAIAAYKPTEDDRVRLVAYGSSDHFAINLKKPSDDEPAVRGDLAATDVFHRVQIGYRHRWSSGSEQNTELTYGHEIKSQGIGALGQLHFDIDTIQGRSEWTGVVSPRFRVTAGIDLLMNRFSGTYDGIPLQTDENHPTAPFSTSKHVSFDSTVWVNEPGAYLEVGIRPLPQLLLTPGVRADYDGQIKRGAVDPRLSLRYEVDEDTAFKAGVGRFSQSPFGGYAAQGLGNPNLDLTHATHATAGVERKIGGPVTLSLEGFAKWLDGMVVETPGGRAPIFENAQDGRIFGAELLARVRPTGRFFGFASYTLMRSERRDPGGSWRLFDRDQTHLVSATGVYRLGRGWEVGASFRYTTGAPYTPITRSTYDATTDVYVPRTGAPLSVRNPAFSRLDLRVEKKWTFTRWSLATYLEVQNVLNSENAEGFNYNYDYARRQAVSGLPILPSLGLRGEL